MLKPSKYVIFISGWLIALVAFILWLHTVTAWPWDEFQWFGLPVFGASLVLGMYLLQIAETRRAVILSAISATSFLPYILLVYMAGLDNPAGLIPFMYGVFILLPYSAILAIISLILLIQWALQVRKARIAAHDGTAADDPITTVDKQNKTAEDDG